MRSSSSQGNQTAPFVPAAPPVRASFASFCSPSNFKLPKAGRACPDVTKQKPQTRKQTKESNSRILEVEEHKWNGKMLTLFQLYLSAMSSPQPARNTEQKKVDRNSSCRGAACLAPTLTQNGGTIFVALCWS